MNTFPTIQSGQSFIFSDEPSDQAVVIASTASGYPSLNKQFTFDPRTFIHELHTVIQADKLIVMTFYETNKDVPFYWNNEQDGIKYIVCFVGKPGCRIDGQKDLWRILMTLRQTTP